MKPSLGAGRMWGGEDGGKEDEGLRMGEDEGLRMGGGWGRGWSWGRKPSFSW